MIITPPAALRCAATPLSATRQRLDFIPMNRRRIAELLATLIVIGMWVAISVEVSNEMSPAPEHGPATVEVAATP